MQSYSVRKANRPFLELASLVNGLQHMHLPPVADWGLTYREVNKRGFSSAGRLLFVMTLLRGMEMGHIPPNF